MQRLQKPQISYLHTCQVAGWTWALPGPLVALVVCRRTGLCVLRLSTMGRPGLGCGGWGNDRISWQRMSQARTSAASELSIARVAQRHAPSPTNSCAGSPWPSTSLASSGTGEVGPDQKVRVENGRVVAGTLWRARLHSASKRFFDRWELPSWKRTLEGERLGAGFRHGCSAHWTGPGHV